MTNPLLAYRFFNDFRGEIRISRHDEGEYTSAASKNLVDVVAHINLHDKQVSFGAGCFDLKEDSVEVLQQKIENAIIEAISKFALNENE